MFGKKKEQEFIKQDAEEYRKGLTEAYKKHWQGIGSYIASEPFDCVSSVNVGQNTFVVGEIYRENHRKDGEIRYGEHYDYDVLGEHDENEKIMFCMQLNKGKLVGHPLVVHALSRERCAYVNFNGGRNEGEMSAQTSLSLFYVSNETGKFVDKKVVFDKSCRGYNDTREAGVWGEKLVLDDFREKMQSCWANLAYEWHHAERIGGSYKGKEDLKQGSKRAVKAVHLFDRFVNGSSKLSSYCSEIADKEVKRYDKVERFHKNRKMIEEKRKVLAQQKGEKNRAECYKQEVIKQKFSDFIK